MADPKTGEMIDETTIKIALMDLAKGAQAGMVLPSELREWAEKSSRLQVMTSWSSCGASFRVGLAQNGPICHYFKVSLVLYWPLNHHFGRVC